jgi:hypothetical protein
MDEGSDFGVDDFPCSYLITTPTRQIAFANKYFSHALDWQIELLVGHSVEVLFSRASHFFGIVICIPCCCTIAFALRCSSHS